MLRLLAKARAGGGLAAAPLTDHPKGTAGRSVASRLVVACSASYPPVHTNTGDAGLRSRSSATLTLSREPYIVHRTCAVPSLTALGRRTALALVRALSHSNKQNRQHQSISTSAATCVTIRCPRPITTS